MINNNESLQKKWQAILWGGGFVIIVLITVVWYRVLSYDTKDYVVTADTTNSKVYVGINGDSKTQDTWETTIQLSDKKEDYQVYTGITCTADIVNQNQHNIKNWNLKINILKECYLNKFWCGSFEIHQFRDNEEKINVVDSQEIDLSTYDIDYNLYSENMMIHLLPGDYLVYLPSEHENEELVKGNDSIGIGFIFYYQGKLDLSDYELTYNNDLRMKDDVMFIFVCVLMALWICVLVIYMYLKYATKKIMFELNNRIKNMSIMSEVYHEVFMINLDNDSAVLIKGNEDKLIFDIAGRFAQEKINSCITENCQSIYRASLSSFLNLSTVKERMRDTNHISYEFVDEELGWCIVRLFLVGESNNQIVFALQDINEEKIKVHEVENRIEMAEFNEFVKDNFIGTISFAMNDIVAKIMSDSMKVSEGLQDSEQYVEQKEEITRVLRNTKHLTLIQNMLFDMYAIEAEQFHLNEETYNIHEMIECVTDLVTPYALTDKYEFKVEVDKDIPSSLLGDRIRLEQIISVILMSSLMVTQKGFVKLSVFGKNNGNEEELVFSVRDSAFGFTEEQITEINAFINGSRVESFDNASLVYLKIINGILEKMGSSLKIVSVFGEGSEFYFSLKQKID